MLRELYVENFALIEQIRLDLASGLTAISGETGAGKSLIIDAVALLIGGKGNEFYIREGHDKCYVEGVFSPPYTDEILATIEICGFSFEPVDDLIISREYTRSGRNNCRINSRSVNLQTLRQVGRFLINIHGQMEHMLLLEEEKQLQLLDNFAGETLLQVKSKVAASYGYYEQCRNLVREFEEKKTARAKRIEELKYQIDEIGKAYLRTGEEEELAEEKIRLLHGEKLLRYCNSIYQDLASNGAAIDRISQALSAIREVIAIDERTAALSDRLNEVYYNLEDIAGEISDYRDNIPDDPNRLEGIDNRVFLINGLKKKYGSDIPQILSYLKSAETELAELEEGNISIHDARNKLLLAEQDYDKKAQELSNLRKESAQKLSERISEELKLLYMPQAEFRVDLIEHEVSAHGLEKALFMIRSNVGEKYQPVEKIASGGELSRIVLAIKVVLAELEQVPTLIFDEVDSGLGGKALSAVAKRMAFVGEYTQSLCVTHSPLMAAAADNQIYIYKEVVNNRTKIMCRTLEHGDRIRELARMIAGENISDTTLAQAAELLK